MNEYETSTLNQTSHSAMRVENPGAPLHFTNVENFAGFSAESGKGGQSIKIWTKLSLTSDEPLFHRLVENFANVVEHMARQAGIFIHLRRTNVLLLILKPNDTAELWLDTAAVSIQCSVKRTMTAGAAVFERDIADITGMSFPCVNFGKSDKVLCLFRKDWRFGFAFDMNPEGEFNLDEFTTTLGTLYREMRYKHLYDALNEMEIFSRLLNAGWFPFAEIISSEFKDILNHCEAGFDLSEIEDNIIEGFDNARMQHILERWITKPHFATKANLLNAAINAFNNKEPIAVIKIILTEIEGVLNDAYKNVHNGQGAKLKELLRFVKISAEHRAGGKNTLLFPKVFGQYLEQHTFASFDPVAQTGTAGSRHAVGHGAAPQESYTMSRALQTILTLDQIAFYT